MLKTCYHADLPSHHFRLCRYKLTFIAKDDTGEAAFFCHDDTARLIVRRACSYLINPLHPENNLPKGLADIISKTFTFVIELGDDSFFTMKQRKYNVKGITVHPDLQPPLQQPLLIQMNPQSTDSGTIVVSASAGATSSQNLARNQSDKVCNSYSM